MVVVRYLGKLKELTGTSQESLPAKNVRGLLCEIKMRYGIEAYKTARTGHIIVDGQNAGSHGSFGMKLTDGNVVQLLPVCGGG